MFLLAEVLIELGRELPRLAIVRSGDVLRALECDEIDIALVHGCSMGLGLSLHQQELWPGITGLALVEWRAAVVRKDDTEKRSQRPQFYACWEPGSMGDQLSREAGQVFPTKTNSAVGIPCQSFLHAIELVRRGLIEEVVVPDIYLPRPAVGFVIEPIEVPIRDQLAAVYRTQEEPRWAWLFERSAWERTVSRTRKTR